MRGGAFAGSGNGEGTSLSTGTLAALLGLEEVLREVGVLLRNLDARMGVLGCEQGTYMQQEAEKALHT